MSPCAVLTRPSVATRCSRVLLALVLLLSGIALPTATYAATITVTSTQQEQPFVTNGNCTLGEAIQAANTDTAVDTCPAGNGADTITLAEGATYELTMIATVNGQPAGLPSIDTPIILQGDNTTIRRKGDTPFRLIIINVHGSLTIQGLILAGGRIQYSSTYGLGGGIYNLGSLYIIDTIVTENYARYGAGIYSSGTMRIEHSTLHQNILLDGQSDTAGGGVMNTGRAIINASNISNNLDSSSYGADGAAIANGGVITITNSIIQNNTAARSAVDNAGTMFIGESAISGNTTRRVAGINNSGKLTLQDSSINSNVSEGGVGALLNIGVLELSNSTVSGNSGHSVGGILNAMYTEASQSFIGRFTMSHTTIANNKVILSEGGDNVGGILNLSTAPITITHSIIGGNTLSDGSASDCAGAIVSHGYNLIQEMTGCSLTSSVGDLTGIDPRLGPLQNNGGPTWTHLPLPGSPAIDAGDPSYAGPLVTDQRGPGFPRVVGGRVDIGAVEVGQEPIRATPTSTALPAIPTATLPIDITPIPTTPNATPTALPLADLCARRCVWLPAVQR